MRRRACIAIVACLIMMKSPLVLAESVLDSFETIDGWTAIGTDGALVELARDTGVAGNAMRIDYKFPVGGPTARKSYAATQRMSAPRS